MPFFVYILQSQKDSSLYVGQTADLHKRLLRHNKGKSRYTSSKKPWKIIYSEQFNSRSEAIKREIQLKSLRRKDLLLNLANASARGRPD